MNRGFSKDRVYKRIERSMDNIINVKGTTVIQHKIRVSLGITLREYVLLDFISGWHSSKKEPITFGHYYAGTGIYPQFIGRMFSKLKEKGLLFKDVDGKVKTTKKWEDCFSAVVKDQFEELWLIMNTGVKSKARPVFAKAIKTDSFENIKNGLIAYKNHKEEINQFPVHLSSFLNPKYRIWQETLNSDAYKNKPKPTFIQEIKQTTGPKSKL